MSKHWDTPFGPSEVICKNSLQVPETCKENQDSFTSLEEVASSAGWDYVDEIEAKAPGLPWNDHDVEYGYRDGFIAGAEWQKQQMMKEAVEFECIGKKVKMTVQELINYYIDTECCDVADECGF